MYLSSYISTYIAPLQGNYSEALPAQARPKRRFVIRHVVCAGALGWASELCHWQICKYATRYFRFMRFHRYAPLLRLVTALCMSWHYEETKSSVDWSLPIKLRTSDPTHCAFAHDMSIRPIHVEVILYLRQTDPGRWDVEKAYSYSQAMRSL